MKGTVAALHLGMVQRFPRLVNWVPRRRRAQVRSYNESGPDTMVIARSEAAFYAWLGQRPAHERSRYAYLDSPEQLTEFRGRVYVLKGGWARKDAVQLVEAVEPRVQCGYVRWAA